MKRAVLLVVLILAAALLGVLALVPRGSVVAPEPLISAGPGDELERIESLGSGGRGGARLERAEPVGFMAGVGEAGGWPVDESRVRAAWRVLRSATITPERSSGSLDAALSAEIAFGSGAAALRISAPVAGLSVARVAQGSRTVVGTVDGSLHGLLDPASLLAWRTLRVLPAQEGQWASMRAESGGRTVHLRRVQGRWGLVAPGVALAEAALVSELERQLLTLQAVALRDEIDVASLDASPPVVTIECESAALRHVLRVVAPVDEASTRWLAVAEIGAVASRGAGASGGADAAPTVARVVVELDATAIESVISEPDHYIARRVLRNAAGDVARLEIARDEEVGGPGGAPLVAERTLDGWRVGGEPADGAEAVARVLTDSMASGAAFVGAGTPGGLVSPVVVRAGAFDGGLLVEATVGVSNEADGLARLVVVAGGVRRVYEPDATTARALEWLAAMSRR